jgi:hypothetical protein
MHGVTVTDLSSIPRGAQVLAASLMMVRAPSFFDNPPWNHSYRSKEIKNRPYVAVIYEPK